MAHAATLGAPRPHTTIYGVHMGAWRQLLGKKVTWHGVLQVVKVCVSGLGGQGKYGVLLVCKLMPHTATLGVPLIHLNKQQAHMDAVR